VHRDVLDLQRALSETVTEGGWEGSTLTMLMADDVCGIDGHRTGERKKGGDKVVNDRSITRRIKAGDSMSAPAIHLALATLYGERAAPPICWQP